MNEIVSMREVAIEEFVGKWIEAKKQGKMTNWIADELGCTQEAVYKRSVYLRNNGVKLPNLRKKIEMKVDELNALIEREFFMEDKE